MKPENLEAEEQPEETPEQKEFSEQLKKMAEQLEKPNETQEKKEPENILERIHVGDVMVSKSGTRRELKEIIFNKDDPQNSTLIFDRISGGFDSKRKKEQFVAGDIDEKMSAISHILNKDQSLRSDAIINQQKNEHAKKALAWDENLFRGAIDQQIIKEDLLKQEQEDKQQN